MDHDIGAQANHTHILYFLALSSLSSSFPSPSAMAATHLPPPLLHASSIAAPPHPSSTANLPPPPVLGGWDAGTATPSSSLPAPALLHCHSGALHLHPSTVTAELGHGVAPPSTLLRGAGAAALRCTSTVARKLELDLGGALPPLPLHYSTRAHAWHDDGVA